MTFPVTEVPSLSIRFMQETSSIIKEKMKTYIDCAVQHNGLFSTDFYFTMWRNEIEESCQYRFSWYCFQNILNVIFPAFTRSD